MSADVSFKWPDFNLLLFVLNTNIKKKKKGKKGRIFFYDISVRVVRFFEKQQNNG